MNLVPDPIDNDAGFREEIMNITDRTADKTDLGPIDEDFAQALSAGEMMRTVKRLPSTEMKAYSKQRLLNDLQEFTDADIDSVVQL